MAAYNAEQALDLLLESSFHELDSGDEEDIHEDPTFPLPTDQESEDSDSDSDGMQTKKALKLQRHI